MNNQIVETVVNWENMKDAGRILTNDGRPPIQSIVAGIMDFRVPLGYTAEQVRDCIIKVVLSREGTTIKIYDELRWKFEIEYGTEPIANTKWREVGKKFIEMRKDTSRQAAEKALNMFPHNAKYAEPFNEEDILDRYAKRSWCLFDLNISRTTEPGQELVIGMTKRSKDSRVGWELFTKICGELTVANMNWGNRVDFLSWVEGTTGVEQVSACREDEHIQTYLFNHWIVRDICSFLPVA
jgi:hypothetical protein